MVLQHMQRCATRKNMAVLITAMWLATPAQALYKVVSPEGKVSYTDRPTSKKQHKLQPLSHDTTTSNNAPLPYELNQTTQRFPVTLYTTDKCAPCDSARQLLKQRGVPFAEKTIKTQADNEALQQQIGGRELPSATIGNQALRGLQPNEWHSYLDTAGYPKQSQLPTNFQHSTAKPLTPPKEPVNVPSAKPDPITRQEPRTEPTNPTAGGFRF